MFILVHQCDYSVLNLHENIWKTVRYLDRLDLLGSIPLQYRRWWGSLMKLDVHTYQIHMQCKLIMYFTIHRLSLHVSLPYTSYVNTTVTTCTQGSVCSQLEMHHHNVNFNFCHILPFFLIVFPLAKSSCRVDWLTSLCYTKLVETGTFSKSHFGVWTVLTHHQNSGKYTFPHLCNLFVPWTIWLSRKSE